MTIIGPVLVVARYVVEAFFAATAVIFIIVGAAKVIGDIARWHAEPGNDYRRALADLGRCVAGRKVRR